MTMPPIENSQQELSLMGFQEYCDNWNDEPDSAISLSKFSTKKLFEEFQARFEMNASGQIFDLISDIAILKREFDGASKFITLGLDANEDNSDIFGYIPDPEMINRLLQRRYSSVPIVGSDTFRDWAASLERPLFLYSWDVSPLHFFDYADEFIHLASEIGDVFRESDIDDQDLLLEIRGQVDSILFFGELDTFTKYAIRCSEVFCMYGGKVSEDVLQYWGVPAPVFGEGRNMPATESNISLGSVISPFAEDLISGVGGTVPVGVKPRRILENDEFGMIWPAAEE